MRHHTIVCDICHIALIHAAPSTLKWHKIRSKSCQLAGKITELKKTHILEESIAPPLRLRVYRTTLVRDGLSELSVLLQSYPDLGYMRRAWWPKWLVHACSMRMSPTKVIALTSHERAALELEYNLIVSIGGAPLETWSRGLW